MNLPDFSNEVVYDASAIEELLERKKNGRPLLMRLFEIYLEETPRLLGELQAAIASRDEEEIYEVVHQLKGSAAAMGARRLFRVTESVLPLCNSGAVLEIAHLVELLKGESDAFIEAITELVKAR